MSEQDGEAEVRTGFSASCVQVLWGKKKNPKPPCSKFLEGWRRYVWYRDKGSDTARSNVSILVTFL